MHPYRGIVRTHIRSEGLSMIPDDSNTLTRQSNGMNNAPRDLLQVPATWNPSLTRFTVYFYVSLHTLHICRGHDCCERCNCFMTMSSDTSFIQCKSCHQHQKLQRFQPLFDLLVLIRFDIPFLTWFKLMVLYWFNSLFPTWFDSPFLTSFYSFFLTSFYSLVFRFS